MAITAEQILDQLRDLTPAERLRVAERIVHDVAREVTADQPAPVSPIWADESDTDFEAFQSAVTRLRDADVWRASDAPRTR
jgi:hypothetical protein